MCTCLYIQSLSSTAYNLALNYTQICIHFLYICMLLFVTLNDLAFCLALVFLF